MAYPAINYIATAGVMVAIFYLRRPSGWAGQTFWAEDGGLFFLQADTLGWRALVTEYAGYHHLLLRAVAAVTLLAPLSFQPQLYAAANLAGLLGVAAALFSPRLPFPAPARPALAIALVAIPHPGEVIHNLTNLQWVLALLLVLAALASPPAQRTRQGVESGVLFLLGVTGPFSIVFAPLFLVRAGMQRSFANGLNAAAVTLAAAIQAATLLGHDHAGSWRWLPTLHAIDLVAWRWLGGMLLPASILDSIPARAFTVLAGLGAAVGVWHVWRRTACPLWVALLLSAALLQLGAVIFKFRADYPVLAALPNGGRYFYVPQVISFWLLTAAAGADARVGRTVARAALVAVALTAAHDFHFPPYPDLRWSEQAARIEAGQAVEMAVHPGMSFNHPGRRSARPAPE